MTKCGHVYCWPCMLHYLSLSDKYFSKEMKIKAECQTISEKIVKYYIESENMKGFNDINLLGLNKEMALIFSRGRLSNIEIYQTMNKKAFVCFKNYSGNIKSLIINLNKITESPLIIEEVNGDSSLIASFLKTSSAIKFPSPKETQIPFPSEDINYLWKIFIKLRKEIKAFEASKNESYSFSLE